MTSLTFLVPFSRLVCLVNNPYQGCVEILASFHHQSTGCLGVMGELENHGQAEVDLGWVVDSREHV